VAVIAVGTAVVAARTGAAPTGWPVADAAWAAGLAVGVVLLASRARRWAWLVSSGLVAVAAGGGWWLALGALAVALAVASSVVHRHRVVGAGVGACTVLVALHLPEIGTHGGSAVVAGVALLPLLISGYRACAPSSRRRVAWGVTAFAVVVLLAAGALFVAVMLAWEPSQDAAASARGGLEAASGGSGQQAGSDLDDARRSFEEADASFSAWWVQPARAVPVLSQHLAALQAATTSGATVTARASASADVVDLDALRYTDGRIDVFRLRAAAPDLVATSEAVDIAVADLDEVRSPWLASPLVEQVEELRSELVAVAPDAEVAALAAQQLPTLLGADGPRRYLLLFTTPAEARGAGGFVGSWAVLQAQDGGLDLVADGRAADINETPGRETRRVTAPEDYVQRYSRFRPGYWFQDVTLSPDIPSVATAAAEVFDAAGFGPVDGVVVLDPEGLAALLALTGPVRVPGWAERIGPDNAVDFLLRRQYVELPDDEQREQVLTDLLRVTVDQLVSGDLPGPDGLADLLGPVVDARRLAMVSFEDGPSRLLGRVGATGAFPAPAGQDLAALTTQNGANNKIDVFLHRDVDVDVVVEPVSGRVESRVRIDLHNEAPDAGLPAAILGSNDQGLPSGTNRMYLSWYSGGRVVEAKVDGVVTPFQQSRELGWYVASTYLDIPPGGARTIELVTVAEMAPGVAYRLDVPAQPLVNPDRWTVRLDGHAHAFDAVGTTTITAAPRG